MNSLIIGGKQRYIDLAFAGGLIVIALSFINSPHVSALDLSPVTETVTRTLDRPLNRVPVVGSPVVRTTDTLLDDTVSNTVDTVAESVLPESVDQTLDAAIQTTDHSLENTAQALQPITNELAATLNDAAQTMSESGDGLFSTAQSTATSLLPDTPRLNPSWGALTPRLPQDPKINTTQNEDSAHKSLGSKNRSNTIATRSNQSERSVQDNTSPSILEPIISGWDAAIHFIAEQPLIGIVTLAALYIMSLGTLAYFSIMGDGSACSHWIWCNEKLCSRAISSC